MRVYPSVSSVARHSSYVTDAVTMTTRMMTGRLAAAQRAVAEAILPELAQEVPDASSVELILTDRYEQVAGEFAVQAVDQANENLSPADYSATKADGAIAVAKTIELADERVVIVASSGLLASGLVLARRALLHEAQHVRLIQHGDSAFAVHRKVPFDLPVDLTWEFLWLAESALDEFRCERAVYQRDLAAVDPDTGASPGDYQGIVATFERARRDYRRTGHLRAVYDAAFASLDRLVMFLAYGSASVASSPAAAAATWDPVPPMAPTLHVLQIVPGTDERLSFEQRIDIVTRLARVFRSLLQRAGFDHRYTPDGAYFELLR